MAQRTKGARMAAAAIALVAVPALVHAQDMPARKKTQQGPGVAGKTSKPEDSQAAKKAYESGLASYKAGKFEPASQSLSLALRGGGLQSSEMARAMYTRGLAYRKLGKSALAISDLTSSIWLKNGLNDAERADALSNRSAAYKEAGLQEPGAVMTIASAPGAPAPEAGAPAASPGSSWNIFSSNSSSSGSSPSQASAPAAPANGIQQPLLSAAPVEPAQAASQEPGQSPVQSPSSSSGGIGGFFGNMFGGTAATASPTTPASSSGLTTSSTSGAADAPPPAPETATSSWDSATEVAVAAPSDTRPAQIGKTLKTASIEGLTPSAEAQAVTVVAPLKGKFKMHIAAVRSREEADALAAKIVAEHGAALGGRIPVVDEATIGSMGKFYRVRVAPFMTAEDARSPCKTLKAGGYDCLVVMK